MTCHKKNECLKEGLKMEISCFVHCGSSDDRFYCLKTSNGIPGILIAQSEGLFKG